MELKRVTQRSSTSEWAQRTNRPQVNYSNQQESCLTCKHAQGFPRDRAGASFSALPLQLRHANCFERAKNGYLLTLRQALWMSRRVQDFIFPFYLFKFEFVNLCVPPLNVYRATCISGFSLACLHETLLSDNILILVIRILSPAPPPSPPLPPPQLYWQEDYLISNEFHYYTAGKKSLHHQ